MDVLLVGFIGGFIAGGWRTGFVKRLAGIGFLALSFVLGAYLREPIGALLAGIFNVPEAYAEMVGYAIASTALTVAFHVILNPALSKVAVSGVTKEMDKALGAILGGVEAVLILSVVIVILDTYFGPNGNLGGTPGLGFLKDLAKAIDGTTTAELLRRTTIPFVLTILGPLLPKDVTTLIPRTLPFPTGIPGVPLPTK
jgi:uncharacterized membrane protein required for colicin V production